MLSAAIVVLLAAAYSPRDGDIVFQTSRSPQGQAIQLATRSAYSHVGLVFITDGQPQVLEAVGPVKWTPLHAWVARGQGHRAEVRRLRKADQLLTAEAVRKLRGVAERQLGKPYDSAFGWDDGRLYCSELVYKAYGEALDLRLGRMQALRELDLANPLVRRKLSERYGRRWPLGQKVISPEAIYESGLLVTVAVLP